MTAEPGDVLRNTHFEDRFTCPNCLADHEVSVAEGETEYLTCECGVRLRLELESVPETACYIADLDELEDD